MGALRRQSPWSLLSLSETLYHTQIQTGTWAGTRLITPSPTACGGSRSANWSRRSSLHSLESGTRPRRCLGSCSTTSARRVSCLPSVAGGILWGMMGGLGIGLPPLLNFGSDELKATCCRQILAGEKVICLAITEPSAGSDVANLGTTAEKMDDHYLLNGEKKWITNGVFADYFTVACRTGGDGMKGVSLLLVERSEGVETKQMQCMGVWPSGTTYVTFDDVKVPLCNVIGQENKGFKYIMSNFNHERWQIVAQVNRLARVCIEESWNYAHKRKTFGKRLIDHDVIRWKLAEMARQVECTHAMLEQVTYQMNTMEKNEAMIKLGGTTALLKAHSTKVLEYCAREAAQIFGGASYVRGGQGEKIERIYREVRAFAIPGGSEEIMLDLSIKQGMKVFEMTRGMVTDLAKM